MLGTLKRIVVRELRISVSDRLQSGATLDGQIRHDVQAAVEPTKAEEYAIVSTLAFTLEPEAAGQPAAVSAVCTIIGFFAAQRRLTPDDEAALTAEVTSRINLQMYQIARGKLLRLFAEAGITANNLPLEQTLSLAQPVQVPAIQPSRRKVSTKKTKRKGKGSPP